MRATGTTALLLLATAFGLAAADAGATDISRCAGADGAAAYTDGSCASLGARETAMPSTLLRSLAREAGEAMPGTSASPVQLGQLHAVGADAGGNRPRTYAGCPRTPQELESAFQASVASGDVNELARFTTGPMCPAGSRASCCGASSASAGVARRT